MNSTRLSNRINAILRNTPTIKSKGHLQNEMRRVQNQVRQAIEDEIRQEINRIKRTHT